MREASVVPKENDLIRGSTGKWHVSLKHSRLGQPSMDSPGADSDFQTPALARRRPATLSVSGLHLPAVFVVEKREQYKCCTGRAPKPSL